MHERTLRPFVARTGTVIVEEGQDGAMVGELTLHVASGRVARWEWATHLVTGAVPENAATARAVATARAPFLSGARWVPGQVNPINGTRLLRPLDAIVGYTAVPLHRAGTSREERPAAVEGSSHDVLTDAFRAAAGADIAVMRGFRYGTQVPTGPITMGDLYHFLPIGAQIARVDGAPGRLLAEQIEGSLASVFDPDPRRWAGGWTTGMSGVTYAANVYHPRGRRAQDIRVRGAPLDTGGGAEYSVAGFWYPAAPSIIAACPACNGAAAPPRVLTGDDGEPLDATEVVARYLRSLPDSTARPALGRVTLRQPLPFGPAGMRVIQPLAGLRGY